MLDILLFLINAWIGKVEDLCASTNQDLRLKRLNYSQKSFEGLIVRFQQTSFALIYRPPYSKKNPVQMHKFWMNFVDFLTLLLQENSQPIIIGDFNVPWNLPDPTDTWILIEILNTFNLLQEIEFSMHKAANTLDWIITQGGAKLYPQFN